MKTPLIALVAGVALGLMVVLRARGRAARDADYDCPIGCPCDVCLDGTSVPDTIDEFWPVEP